MSRTIETYLPPVAEDGIVTAKNITAATGSTANFDWSASSGTFKTGSGVTTITGALTVSGATTQSGAFDVAGAFSVATNKFTVAAASGNTAVAGTLGVTGALTPTGGIVAITVPQSVFTVGGWAATTGGGLTDNACAANTVTWSPIYFPTNMTVTGLGFLIGTVGGTNTVVMSMYDATGAFLKSTNTAGVTVGTAANWQAIALTATQAVVANTLYYVATNFNGNTAKYRGYAGPGLKFVTGTGAQTLGTPTTIVPGTSFTNDVGPMMFAY